MSAIDKIKAPVSNELKLFETYFKDTMKSDVKLLNIVTKYILKRKGKQVRPIFVFLTAKLFGEVNDKTYVAASLIELMHTATLIHDDVVDEADKRRGFLSINAVWKNKVAVLVGDYLLSQGLLLSVDKNGFDLLRIVSNAVKDMSEGELLQIEKSRKLDITEEVYFEIIRKKTAVLIAACTAAGTLSVIEDKDIIETARQMGEAIGIAFQIKDDLFDYQKYNDTGKPSGNDLQEKKITLPLIYSLRNAESSERRKILRIVKKDNKSTDDFEKVLAFVKEKKGIDYATKVMNEYKTDALTILDKFPKGEAQESLNNLMEYVITRKK